MTMNTHTRTGPPVSFWISCSLAFLLVPTADVRAQARAFPGAIGFGTETEAGRDALPADIYQVTRLDDDFNNPAVGTLRYGIEKIPRARVIVFATSGVIHLRRDLIVRAVNGTVDAGNLTIAGQTAPYPGITLKNAGIKVIGHDVLIQHIAIRPGNFPDPEEEDTITSNDGAAGVWNLPGLDNRDCIKVEGTAGKTTNRVVIDHVTCNWATDELASTWGNFTSGLGPVTNVTFSNSLFANPIQYAGHDKGQHGYGVLVGVSSSQVSLIRNVMAFNWSRNPLIRDHTAGAQVVNNFIYRPGPFDTSPMVIGSVREDPDDPPDPDPNEFGAVPMTVSAIGNLVIRHPDEFWRDRVWDNQPNGFMIVGTATSELTLHLKGNQVYNPDPPHGPAWSPADPTDDAQQYTAPFYKANRLPRATPAADPYANSGGVAWTPLIGSAPFLEGQIVRRAGKHPALRDPIDTTLVNQIATRTGTWLEMLDWTENPWQPIDVANTRELLIPANPGTDPDGNGYTMLDEWLHDWAGAVQGTNLVGRFDTFTAAGTAKWNTAPWNAAPPSTTGTWTVSGGKLRQASTTLGARAVMGRSEWTDQVVEATVQPSAWGTTAFMAVYVRYRGYNDAYYMTLRDNKKIELKKITTAGGVTELHPGGIQLPASFDLTQPHRLRLQVVGTQLTGFLDGGQVISGSDSEIKSGAVAIGTHRVAASFDDVLASPFAATRAAVADDFEDANSTGWNTTEAGTSGAWTVPTDGSNRVFDQATNTLNARASWNTASGGDQSTQANVKVTSFGGNGFVAVYARYADLNNAYYVTLRNTRLLELKKIRGANTVATLANVQLPGDFDLTKWHTLRIDVTGSSTPALKAYVDGELMLEGTDTTGTPVLTSGKGAVGTYLAAARFDDIVLGVPSP